MAAGAQEVERSISQLARALTELISQSKLGADAVKVLEDALNRLTTASTAKKFSSTDMQKFLQMLEMVGKSAGKTKQDIDKIAEAAHKLQLGFKGLKFDIVGTDQLEQRLTKAARTSGVAKEGIALLRKEIKALDERGSTQHGTVQLLGRIRQDAKLTEEQYKKLVAVARRWRTELEKGQRQQAMQQIGTRRGDRTTKGTEPEEEQIGQRIAMSKEYYGSVLPGGVRAVNNVEGALRKAGMSLGALNDVTVDSARGTVRWTASMQGMDGITRRAVVTTTKFGQVLKSTQRHLRTFAGGIARDITEVMKWSIAIAIVYAPMRKMTDLMKETIQIEAKLADVQVALSGTTSSLAKVWENTTVIARELGVSVEGVIDGYVLAARATANISDPAQKAAATTAVLRDSMLLAKLAGIDQAIAMDTLVGALRQLNKPLTAGTELVDKWVAVSKAANVSLHTLAESFAITATAAANVGVDMDHLNGIIAAVAEVTTLSATESGNAVRAFISGFQSAQSEKALAKFGIAVKNVNGELRAFTDVLESIIERKDLGLISDQEMAKISEIIGGGARRGAQVNAFLQNYGRVQELAAISSNATGDAAEALAIKMDTLQTAAQNLNNAFSELARSLGTDGGFLDLTRGGIKVLTGLVDILNKVVTVLGKATPAVIAFAVAWRVVKRNMAIQSFLDQGVMGAMMGPAGGLGFDQRVKGVGKLAQATPLTGGTTFRSMLSPLGQAGTLGGAVGGAGIGLGMAALSGNLNKENASKAGAQIAGGMLGAFVGGPIGAMIGSTIAQAFVGELEVSVDEIRRVMSLVESGGFKEVRDVGGLAEKPEALGNRIDELLKEVSSEATGVPRWITDMFSEKAMTMAAVPAFRGAVEEAMGAAEGAISDSDLAVILEQEILRVMAGEERTIGEPGWMARDIIQEAMDTSAANPEIRAAAQLLLNATREGMEQESVDLDKAFGLKLLGVSEEFGPLAKSILDKHRQDLLRDVAKGEIGVRALQEFLNIGAFEQVASTIYTALGSVGEATMSYGDVANLLIESTEQERQIFGQLAGEIETLTNEYAELEAATVGYKDAGTRLELQRLADQLNMTTDALEEYLNVAAQGKAYQDFEVPQVVGVAEDATPEQIRTIVANTRRLQQEKVEAMSADPNLQEKAKESWADAIFQIGEIVDSNWTQIFTDLDPSILANQIKEAGLQAQQAAMSFMQIDIPAAQLSQFRGNIQYYQDLLEPTGYLDTQELEDIVLLTNDNQVDAITTYGVLTNLALQDLISVNEQQLEGIFNIPEGVTAQIPVTGKLYFSDQPIPTAGGGNMLKALGPPLDKLATETGDAADTAHDDALTTIDVLNLMLAQGQGSPEFLDRIEALITELGGEPAERGEMVEPVTAEASGWQGLLDAIWEKSEADRLKEEQLVARSLDYSVNPELKQSDAFIQDAVDDIKTLLSTDYYANPELKQHHTFTGLSTEDVLAALPQSIPVTINTRIVNPISVFVDSFLVQQALEDRQYDELQEATRRTGAVGFIME